MSQAFQSICFSSEKSTSGLFQHGVSLKGEAGADISEFEKTRTNAKVAKWPR
jgi:hypothetical protein